MYKVSRTKTDIKIMLMKRNLDNYSLEAQIR